MKLISTLLLTIVLVLNLSAREQVNVNFSDLEIGDFIKLVSKVTNKNILMTDNIKGTVNFVSATPVYSDELLDILISVLESKGFTLVQNGSLYEIVRSTEAAKSNLKIVKKGTMASGSLMVTQTIQIKGENVDIIASKIRHLLSKTAKLVTAKESNMILITDYPKNIKTIKTVIKDIDTNNDAIVKIIPIEHTDAKDLQTKLVDISKSLFNEKIDYEKVKILLDDNVNSLIIVGLERNINELEVLIEKLDIEANNSKSVEVFELKNSDSKSVLASLNAIVSKQVYSDPSMKPNISASDEINSIIVVGKPIMIKAIKQIIDMLDKEKYQVYVKARIVEISKNTAENIGVKYGFAAGDVSSSGLYAMSANFGAASLTSAAYDIVSSTLSSIGETSKAGTSYVDANGNIITNPSNDVVTKAFALGATLDFLETNGASKSISNPSILCVNNKESSIYVGKTIAVSNGTTVNAASGITNNIKREDVGLELKIKPRVSSIDKVTLDVSVLLESILDDGSKNETKQPVTSKQEVKTQTILRNGENIIIGGLVKTTNRDAKNKVPLLGDIPIIGKYLFSSSSNIEEEDSLVVILTPYIIDKSEKLSQLQSNLGLLSNLQKQYNEEVFEKLKEKTEEHTQSTASKNSQSEIKNSIFGKKSSR